MGRRDYICTCTGTWAATSGSELPGRPSGGTGWPAALDDTAVDAACLADVLGDLRRDEWVHRIPG
jgi:hypothetical protein